MKFYLTYLVGLALIIGIFVMTYSITERKISESYVRGYEDGGNYVIGVFLDASRIAIDSCDVIAIPYIKDRDTIVCYLSSKYCDQLDTIINDRFKRGN